MSTFASGQCVCTVPGATSSMPAMNDQNKTKAQLIEELNKPARPFR